MDERHCDWRKKCKRNVYMEVFVFEDESYWSYLCRRHYYWERLKRFFTRRNLAFSYAETEDEYFNRLQYEKEWDENYKLKNQLKQQSKYIIRLQNRIRYGGDEEGRYRNQQYFNALDWVSVCVSRGYEPEKFMSEEINNIKGFFELEENQ
jgi:hypothetical protein